MIAVLLIVGSVMLLHGLYTLISVVRGEGDEHEAAGLFGAGVVMVLFGSAFLVPPLVIIFAGEGLG